MPSSDASKSALNQFSKVSDLINLLLKATKQSAFENVYRGCACPLHGSGVQDRLQGLQPPSHRRGERRNGQRRKAMLELVEARGFATCTFTHVRVRMTPHSDAPLLPLH